MDERLLTFLYQYGVGGLVFVGSLVLLWRHGLLGERPAERRRWVILLLLGLLAYALVQGALQFAGPGYDLALRGAP
jgi:hypothetical protein